MTLRRFYVLDKYVMKDDESIPTGVEYAILVDAAESEAKIAGLEKQCKEWERRTWEALDKLHTAIDQKIGARCEHGVWIADHCWSCGKRSAVETSDAHECPYLNCPKCSTAVNTGAAQKEETLREGVDRIRRELRCKACGAVGEPGSPDYCSLECYEESH